MKITDVVELYEAEPAYGAPGSRAMGNANFGLLSRFYSQPNKRMSANLALNFGTGGVVELTSDDVEAIARYYDTLPADADRYDFVYDTMSRADKLQALLLKLGLRKPTPPPISNVNQSTLDLSEREVKKNSNTDLDRSSVRSAGLSTALRQAYAKYPQAQSDIEALIMHDMDTQKNTSQELQAQNKINRRQDDIDLQLRDVNRQQSNKISNLDQENDDLSAELDRLSQELDAMHRQTGTEPERRKDNDSAAKSSDADNATAYGTPSVNTRSSDRSKKSQQRATDAEKRQPEPARMRPGAATYKPVGATLPMTKPAPAPTIDVIDEPTTSPALGQMVKSLSNPTTSPALRQTAKSLAQPPAKEPILDPDNALPMKMGTDNKDAEEIPNNVFQFPGGGQRGQEPKQADLFDNPPRTGTYNESQELRRMRELAGLTE